MHEYTIAVGIIETLKNYAAQSGFKVRSFKIVVGELSMLNIEAIRMSLDMLMPKTDLNDAYYSIECEEARVGCGTCGAVMTFNEAVKELGEDVLETIHFLPEMLASFTSCRVCGSSDLRVLSGRGVKVVDVTAESK